MQESVDIRGFYNIIQEGVVNFCNNNKPKWKQIAEFLNKSLQSQFPRNPKQCRERWINVIKTPEAEAIKWGIQDDVSLIQACKKHGHRWAKLSQIYENKVNENRLKNHFYSCIRKVVRYINSLLKKVRKEHKNRPIKDELEMIQPTNQLGQEEIFQSASKIKEFDVKYFSKIFSLLDSKRQFKYEAKEAVTIDNLQILNAQIFDLIEDVITGNQAFSEKDMLKIVLEVMKINRNVKTKFTRQSKMSVISQEEIGKAQKQKKKINKKLNQLVKNELQSKVIPNKKMKNEIIEKIKDTQEFKKLIKQKQFEKLGIYKWQNHSKDEYFEKKVSGKENIMNERIDEESEDEEESKMEESEMDESEDEERIFEQDEIKAETIKNKQHESNENNSGEEKTPQSNIKTINFTSTFLNSIPIANKNSQISDDQNKNYFIFPDNNIAFNPFPEHPQHPKQPQNVMEKSLPFMFSSIYHPQLPLRHQRSTGIFNNDSNHVNHKKQGLFASMNFQNNQENNNDKKSEYSQKMKSSLCDLISDLNPNHQSAFQPFNMVEAHPKIPYFLTNSLNLQRSQPFQMNMPGYNLMESQHSFLHESNIENESEDKKSLQRKNIQRMIQSCSISSKNKNEQQQLKP